MIGLMAVGLQVVTLHWYFTHDLREVTHRFGERTVSYHVFTYDAPFAAFDAGVDELQPSERRRCVPGTDVVISSMPHWVFLRSQCLAVIPPFESDVRLASQLLDSVGARFVIVDRSGLSSTEMYALPVASQHDSGWRLVWTDAAGLAHLFERASPRHTQLAAPPVRTAVRVHRDGR
jgi:hypothetical protein